MLEFSGENRKLSRKFTFSRGFETLFGPVARDEMGPKIIDPSSIIPPTKSICGGIS